MPFGRKAEESQHDAKDYMQQDIVSAERDEPEAVWLEVAYDGQDEVDHPANLPVCLRPAEGSRRGEPPESEEDVDAVVQQVHGEDPQKHLHLHRVGIEEPDDPY